MYRSLQESDVQVSCFSKSHKRKQVRMMKKQFQQFSKNPRVKITFLKQTSNRGKNKKGLNAENM